MKIGILSASMSRQAGGLFWSVRSLAESVRNAGCELQVFAGADEYSQQDRAKWGGIPLTVFPTRGPAAFGYQVGLRSALIEAKLNLAHVHGLWMYPSVVVKKLRKQNVPYLISPRGMLDPWAVRNSSWKKRLAGLLFENAHLRGAACIHALCDSEYESIRAYGLSNPIAVIPNGVDLPDRDRTLPAPEWSTLLPANSKVLFFLSRLHPKKGLVNLLHAWAQRKDVLTPNAATWHLVIAGWAQGGHQAELKRLAAELDIEAIVHFVGPQFDHAKAASFMHADAFILPSFSEGLPMAVLEAWSYGLPVVMTPHCNLPEGFKSDASIRVEPNIESIAKGLGVLMKMKECDRITMGSRGHGLVQKNFTWPAIAEQMCSVYQWILAEGPLPDCVRID